MRRLLHILLPLLFLLLTLPVRAQSDTPIRMASNGERVAFRQLTLQETIALAADSALEAFKNANLYQASYWQYRGYKAGRLPSVTLDVMPVEYQHSYQKRYDAVTNTDFYGSTQTVASAGALSIRQNFDWLGGQFFVRSGLEYMRNMGSNAFDMFSAIPFSVGYTQQLLGFNAIRWEKKIEPVKYEQAKKDYLQNVEAIASLATGYFFSLALAQADYDMAARNKESADTLLAIGRKKFEIAGINTDQLYTLQLEQINAGNSLKSAEQTRREAMRALVTFLNLPPDTQLRLTLPSAPDPMTGHIRIEEALDHTRQNSPTYLSNQVRVLEARREVSRSRQQNRFEANFEASVGFNQTATTFGNVWKHPERQEVVRMSVSLPILDWGVRKGKLRMAESKLEEVQISSRQNGEELEKEVVNAVEDYALQQEMLGTTRLAWELAVKAYEQTRTNYIEGSADINALILANNRQETANRNYLGAIRNCWVTYQNIRRLTLHDFQRGISLSDAFEFDLLNP